MWGFVSRESIGGAGSAVDNTNWGGRRAQRGLRVGQTMSEWRWEKVRPGCGSRVALRKGC